MFKKNTQTAMDIRYTNLIYDLRDKEQELCDRAKDAIIKSGVICLYLDGADKERAEMDAEIAKRPMARAISAYDSALAEVQRFYTNNYSQLKTTKEIYPNQFLTSHAIVERAYKEFFNR